MKNFFKVLRFNLLAGFTILFGFELLFGAWLLSWTYHSNVIDYISCKNEITYYGYCPKTTAINRMAPEDGGKWIKNHVNLSGVRVETPIEMASSTNFESYAIYVTGDSFVQADEVEFRETVGYWIQQTTGRPTLHHGYSSWAPVQYMNYLTSIDFKKDDDVIVFLNLADLTPFSHNSNHYWRTKYENELVNGNLRFVLSDEDKEQNKLNTGYGKWIDRSILIRLYSTAKKRLESFTTAERGVEQFEIYKDWVNYQSFNEVIAQVRDDCQSLAEKYSKISPATRDFLVYAFAEKCWPNTFKPAYKSAIVDLLALSNHVKKRQANLYVVLFPMGWSFLGEGIIGKQHPYYAMGPDAVITTLGILPALKRDLPDANVLEVENLLKEQNLSTENDLYFSVDGHWTPKAQKIIGDYLGQLLSQKT